MIFKSLSVARTGLSSAVSPRIQFAGDWLYDIGFINHGLVQVLPGYEGLTFRLVNENIRKYSKLYKCTTDKGGALIRIYLSNTRTLKGPAFTVRGRYILNGGLNMGDPLIARCEPGIITVRKMKHNEHLITISKRSDRITGAPIPNVLLNAGWLTDAGLIPDTLVTLSSKPGLITLTALDETVSYEDACRLSRKNKSRLLKVTRKHGI